MRILFFCHYFPPEVNAPASRTHAHTMRWVAAGHDVTVITCVPNCPDGVVFDGYRNRLVPQVETIDGIRVVRVWSYVAANSGTAKRILNFNSYMLAAVLASLFQSRPDVIVATSPQFFCGWAGVLASWLRWRPLVLEIRDIWPESIAVVGAMKKGLLLRFLEFLEVRMYRSARHIVTVGDGYRDQILAKVPQQARHIRVITNGVDSLFIEPAHPDDALLEALGLKGKFIVSYVGTIGMAHGLEVAIEAARRLHDSGCDEVGFLIVGDGARREALRKLARDSGVESLVIFPGRMPRERMPGILSASDACLIHLKKSDLFEKVIPSKIFETMALGRPIIMGVEGESRDIVMRAGAGLAMEPDSVDSLLNAIDRLRKHPELRQQCGHHARQYVLDHYNRDVLASDYLEVLRQISKRPRAKPINITTSCPDGALSVAETVRQSP